MAPMSSRSQPILEFNLEVPLYVRQLDGDFPTRRPVLENESLPSAADNLEEDAEDNAKMEDKKDESPRDIDRG